jgi:hypothetical protein
MFAGIRNRVRFRDLAVVIAAAWLLVHAALYVAHTRQAWPGDGSFLFAQAGSFVVLLLSLAVLRPRSAGLGIGIQLIVSTLLLLAFACDAAFVARLLVLLLWAACAVCGMRQALARTAGWRYATWGVSAAAVYAALVPLTFLLGFLHLLTPWIVGAVAVAAALPGAIIAIPGLPMLPRKLRQQFDQFDIFELCWLEVIWIILAVAFVGASVPETHSDAVRVHLPYIHQVVRDHGISHQYACWFRLEPMAAQTCCAAFAVVGSDAAAKWFSWLALLALMLLVADEVQERSGSRRLGLFAGAAVLSCPVFVDLAATLYVDHVMALLCTAGFAALFRALRPPCWRGILLSAAIMASTVQVKYPGLIFSVVWGIALCGSLLRHCPRRLALRWSLAGGAMLVFAALPWHAYVYAGTGNPFFPFLHHWFPSPYWIEGFTLQKVFGVSFKLSSGLTGALSFPWIATYQTTRFIEGHNGFIGFWVLALAPCWFLARPRQAGPRWWDVVLAGMAAIAGVVVYTPYIRYWLPAYPLLVVGCVLSAGSIDWSWRLKRPFPRAVAGIALGVLLLLPLPVNCQLWAWDEYTRRIPLNEQLAQHFPGYQTVQELNRILGPEDGVLCTGFEGVHLVAGRPYEFPFWWNDVYRIHDVASFGDFCRRHSIRYWIVDHGRTARTGHETGEIQRRYWTDARMVEGGGTLAVYDVAPLQGEAGAPASQCQWPAVLKKTDKPWAPLDSPIAWINLSGDAATDPASKTVTVTPDRQIAHCLPPPSEGRICKVRFDLCSKEYTYPLADIAWYDAEGKVLDHVTGAGYGRADYPFQVYSRVPPGAKAGWVRLRAWQSPLELKGGSVAYWSLAAPANVACRRGHGDSF